MTIAPIKPSGRRLARINLGKFINNGTILANIGTLSVDPDQMVGPITG